VLYFVNPNNLQIIAYLFVKLYMNDRIGSFYVVVFNNEVICFDTNLKLFVEQFNKMMPQSRNYDWFYRAFKKESKFSQVIGGNEYYFQRLI
jgi:hypothetical protein